MGKLKAHIDAILETAFYNLEYAPCYHEAYETILRHQTLLDCESRAWCEALYQKRCIADRHSHD